ncbi:hypothetical protein FQN52_000361 [Onygenales sp. PD_12]|nr:hypothetical protein FQN52_000361 [Onygenales sp. PD_12]
MDDLGNESYSNQYSDQKHSSSYGYLPSTPMALPNSQVPSSDFGLNGTPPSTEPEYAARPDPQRNDPHQHAGFTHPQSFFDYSHLGSQFGPPFSQVPSSGPAQHGQYDTQALLSPSIPELEHGQGYSALLSTTDEDFNRNVLGLPSTSTFDAPVRTWGGEVTHRWLNSLSDQPYNGQRVPPDNSRQADVANEPSPGELEETRTCRPPPQSKPPDQPYKARKKGNSCVICRVRSHRQCIGSPYCRSCRNMLKLSYQSSNPDLALFETPYLDYDKWRWHLDAAKDATQQGHIDLMNNPSSDLLLEMVIQGVSGQSSRDRRPVALPQGSTVLHLPDFDSLLDQIWPPEIVEKEKKLMDDEAELYAIARRFCACLAILHDLHKTYIRTNVLNWFTNRRIGFAFIDTLVHRITTLHEVLMGGIRNLHTQGDRRHVGMSVLEIVAWCVLDFQKITWGPEDKNVPPTLLEIRNFLNRGAKSLLKRIVRYDCPLSGSSEYQRSKKRVVNVATLQFIRPNPKRKRKSDSQKSNPTGFTSLPSAVTIAYEVFGPDILPWKPALDRLHTDDRQDIPLIELLWGRATMLDTANTSHPPN